MTRNGKKRKRVIAAFFFALLLVDDFYPATAYALTSGPSQPEMQKFSPAGVNDMVDLFSGDFKYDIPLMDVGGYPLNLTYHSGTGIEDEASWVGVGWTLNPGSVNRNMRGIPDDFTGDNSATDPQDAIRTIQHQKEFHRIGGNLVLKPTLFGFNQGSASLKIGIYKDNYYGIGADLGASINFTLASMGCMNLNAGLGLTTDSKTGVTVDPSLSLSASLDESGESNVGINGGFKYNTRSGLESVSLGTSFNFSTNLYGDMGIDGPGQASFNVGSFTKLFDHSYTPTFGTNIQNSDYTFSFDLGAALFGGYIGIGGEGYVHKQTNMEPHSSVPAYGYMHYTSGTKNPAAMLDFNREKDGVFITAQPAIPVPVSTEDYFEATSQAGAQQFRPWYNGNYVVWDRSFSQVSSALTAGVSFGAGNIWQAGAQLNLTSGNAITHEWPQGYGSYGAAVPPPATSDPCWENVYFKQAGEQTKMDPTYYTELGGDNTQKVMVSTSSSGAQTLPTFVTTTANYGIGGGITRTKRDKRTSTFSYLTAAEAAQYGLDKMIAGVLPRVGQVPAGGDPDTVAHKPHHISQITVTDKDGKRMVYGIPVYNYDKEEVSMSVAGDLPGSTAFATDRRKGLFGYNVGTDNSENNSEGRMNIYNRKSTPPYATSWLLTGILSPDYVDLTGDGISDDDLGTAVKFQYNKFNNYNWRAPYDTLDCNYNEQFLSDQTDDKGEYVFGSKELWYLASIRSKTMVAIFYTSARQDGIGSAGESGGRSIADTVQRLDSIRLFSSADLAKNGANAIPIKVAHFVYDYSLYPGVTNNMGLQVMDYDPTIADPVSPSVAKTDLNATKGKLTLRKIYFTFGNSSRGQTNPYIFSYDMRLINSTQGVGLPLTSGYTPEATDQYTTRETDRWGTYRQNWFATSAHDVFINSEYPYSIQPSDNEPYDQRLLADRFASKWQLTSITTPTAGVITVNYESDDYSYVQDQNAMVMCSLAGVGTAGTASGLTGTNTIWVTVPAAVTSYTDFINTYLSGPNGTNRDNIYYRLYSNIDNRGHMEYVSGYAEIDYSDPTKFTNPSNDQHTWSIPVKMVNGYNPMVVQAWQFLQTSLPQFAYPNYDNSDVDGLTGDVAAAVRSIVQAFANLRELGENFDEIASGSGYADNVDLAHSLIRLNYPLGKVNGNPNAAQRTYGKLGGGSRVHSIELSDTWQAMVGGKSISHGIQYDYTMPYGNTVISSGVAAYEPEIGNEENPFHQPVDYTEKIEWGLDRYHFAEQPFGESYFPAPSVGYSQVKATPYGADYSNPSQPVVDFNTGYTISQFYTARDFPTQTDYMPLEEDNYENDLTLLLFGSEYTDRVTTTQGFKIILNDMHGKSKSTQTYDYNNNLISSTQYFYNVADQNAQRKTLNNTVLAMDDNGSIPGGGMLIGTDAELITDLRESISSSNGTTVGANGGVFSVPFPPFALPYVGFNYNATASMRSYNSASTIKVIHQYGLLQEVRTTQNGSTLTADNLLWDAQTGAVLLTRNQNEFNDYTYALNYPACRGYDGMSGAYKNIGMVFSQFGTDPYGDISTDVTNTLDPDMYNGYLSPGDELMDIDPGTTTHGWVIQPPSGGLLFIDQTGNFITNISSGTFMVVRSGRRNQLNASAGSVVTMVNPLIQGGNGYILEANVDEKVLDSKAVTYKDEWGLPVPNYQTVASRYSNSITDVDLQPGLPDYNITYSGNVSVCSQPTLQASVGFSSGRIANPTRGFLTFGASPASDFTPPTGAMLTSVILTLTSPSGTTNSATDDNVAYIQRVTQATGCGNIVWPGAPTTTSNMAQLPATGVNGVFSIDVTAMYNEWNNMKQKDDYAFDVALVLANETTPILHGLSFIGPGNPSGTGNPTLTFNYYVPGQCAPPVGQVINPYYAGVKGNWRPYYNYAYQVNRTQSGQNSSQNGGTDIRNAGYYTSYTPFWEYNKPMLIPIAPVPGSPGVVADPRWVWSTQSIYYDQKGNEVENVDALNRYSSVLFGYQQSLATGVAANARHNEIAFDGFEDYYFSLPTNAAICPTSRQLEMGFTQQGGQYCSGGSCIVSGISHTGNYSLQLGGTISVSSPQPGNPAPPSQWIGYDAAGHCILLANEQAAGFAPILNKKYLLSLWVNDSTPNSSYINGLQVTINGQAQPVSTTPTPVVEGWKQLNLYFTAGSSFSMQLTGGANIYIDDIRLLPFDGEMKTFVYDDQSLRLMGQLDENNFGILYEYDEEGTPIRVKKETERGMMTVKENRQSLHPH